MEQIQMINRYHPPVVNDESERPDYVSMIEHIRGDFVEYEDYACLQQNQRILRDVASRLMVAVKNACVDEVTTRLVNADDPKVIDALQELEKVLMNMNVDFSVLAPRDEF
jgi:hypothetical protein